MQFSGSYRKYSAATNLMNTFFQECLWNKIHNFPYTNQSSQNLLNIHNTEEIAGFFMWWILAGEVWLEHYFLIDFEKYLLLMFQAFQLINQPTKVFSKSAQVSEIWH